MATVAQDCDSLGLTDIDLITEMYSVAILKIGARGQTRTGTINDREILSLLCLPIPPHGRY